MMAAKNSTSMLLQSSQYRELIERLKSDIPTSLSVSQMLQQPILKLLGGGAKIMVSMADPPGQGQTVLTQSMAERSLALETMFTHIPPPPRHSCDVDVYSWLRGISMNNKRL